jgi:hypothetical protein
VQGAIARQHAVSEQATRAPKRLSLREAMLTGDEHLLDVVGMVEQEHAKRGEPDVHDVAVFSAQPLDKGQRIAAGLRRGCRRARCLSVQAEGADTLR